jgi:hypothetical protein
MSTIEPWRRALIDWAIVAGRVILTPQQQVAFADPIARERLYQCTPGYQGWDYLDPARQVIGEDAPAKRDVKKDDDE